MKLRAIDGRPVVEDEHSPYHDTPHDGIFLFQRLLIAAVVLMLLALAGALIYVRLG